MTDDAPSEEDERDARPRLVEYCLANVTPSQRARLDDADVRTRSVGCLDRCGTCHRSQFLVLDGTVVVDDERVRRLAGE
ncbi:DUF1450 domain-containing protein [Halorussus salinisoli]|uniref:DUF1450 domain-containing protein n=1 Tax=Halorussus salinisoli TaxID=2558242 RepID=UPI001484F5E4|nr:DUF1450 domain-containing protein [Halorussus salinisoli]